MKVTLIMVASLDGKTTEGHKPGAGSWASPEDQAFFCAQMSAHDRIVMGSATYEAARSAIKPESDRIRVVMTRTPQKFAKEQRPGLKFSADSPQEIIEQTKGDGCRSLLLVGGAKTNAHFFSAGLIDEVLVTIEPLLFGTGTPFVTTLERTVKLKLIDHMQINRQGTLLVHYLVQKSNEGASGYENKKI